MELFKRNGEVFKGEGEIDDKGRMTYTVAVPCDRCHVVNGQRVWLMGMENGRPYSRTGFDCWTCGNTGVRRYKQERLYTAAELAKSIKLSAAAAARKEAKAAAKHAEFEAAKAAKLEAFTKANADIIAKLNTLDGKYWEDQRAMFLDRQVDATPKFVEMVDAEVAKRQANAASDYVGEIGKRLEFTLTVEHFVALPTYFYGQAQSYLNFLRDQNGNAFVYKGTVGIGEKGETITLKATVAGHDVYNGTKQTWISRPKIIEAVAA